MTELKVKCESCGHLQRLFDYDKHTFDIPANQNEAFNKWLEEHDKQIRADERKKIMKIVDSADDNAQAMYLLGQYIITEELKEQNK